MKKCVYTAIFGNYDTPLQPKVINEDWDYILFTDQNKNTGIWEKRILKTRNSRLQAREIKLNFSKYLSYDVIFWIDANVVVNCDLDAFIENHTSEVVTLKHPHRKNIAEEAYACKKYRKDMHKKIDSQVGYYKKQGYGFDNGLVATTIMLRRNTTAVREFCSQWWREVSTQSIRDQLSFNYVLWKYPINLELISWNIFNADFEYREHKRWRN